jgi:hypothetical protein
MTDIHDSGQYVTSRGLAAVDLLAFACEVDHGELDFDDPRRSYDALEEAAARFLEEFGWQNGDADAVQHLANIAANMLRCLVGDDLDRIQKALELQRVLLVVMTTTGRGAGPRRNVNPSA